MTTKTKRGVNRQFNFRFDPALVKVIDRIIKRDRVTFRSRSHFVEKAAILLVSKYENPN